MNESTRYDIVCKTRHVLDKHADDIDKKYYGEFPGGLCGNVSELLGFYLLRCCKLGDIKYMSGANDNYGYHTWLELDGLIIDITSDQFSNGLGEVYIGSGRDFHDELEYDENGQFVRDFKPECIPPTGYNSFISYMESDK